MAEPVVMRTGHTKSSRVWTCVSGAFGLALFVGIVWLWYIGEINTPASLILLAMWLIFPYAIIDHVRYELVLTEQSIVRRGIRRKCLLYSDITAARLDQHGLVVWRNRLSSVHVTNLTADTDKVIRFVLAQVRHNAGIRLLGDKKLLAIFLDRQDDEVST